MPKNCRIMHTQITNKIRVSTAAIWRDGSTYNPTGYYLYETWCFSDDERQNSIHVPHSTWGWLSWEFFVKPIKIHRHISANLKKKFKEG